MKIFFAGAINFLPTVREAKVKHILVSYWELNDKVTLKGLHEEGFNIMVDSGAYSFQESTAQKRVNFEEYLVEYIEFLQHNKDYYESCVELDIDKIVGVEQVKKYRTIMENAGLNPMVVWHPPRGFEAWKEHCRDYERIGFNTINDIRNMRQMRKMMEVADKYDVKVHGFGTTKTAYMENFDFYSVDSTSWLAGGRFGHFFQFDGRTLTSTTANKFQERHGKAFNKLSYKRTHVWNAVQWRIYSDHLEQQKWRKK